MSRFSIKPYVNSSVTPFGRKPPFIPNWWGIVGGGGTPIDPNDLVLEVDPDGAGSPSGTFIFPLTDLGLNASIEIFWGDGSSDVITEVDQAELTHVYGTITHKDMIAVASSTFFWGDGDVTKVVEVVQEGYGTQIQTYSANVANLDGSTMRFTGGDNFDVGTANLISFNIWMKTTDASEGFMITKMGAGGTDYYYIVMRPNGSFKVGVGNVGGGQYVRPTIDSGFNDGDLHHVVATINRSARSIVVKVDNSVRATTIEADSGTITNVMNSPADFRIGARATSGSFIPYAGALVEAGISIGSDLTLDSTVLYNKGVVPCSDILPQSVKDKFSGGWSLANYPDHTGLELTDWAGSTNLADVGSVPFTGSADIQCEA